MYMIKARFVLPVAFLQKVVKLIMKEVDSIWFQIKS